MAWYGFDPGGTNSFGAARLSEDGHFETKIVSSTRAAIEWMADGPQPFGIGIDAPLWWSDGVGGGRRADQWLRYTYKIPSGTVQSVNSLRGAALVQGIGLPLRAWRRFPGLPVTEAHPKALLWTLGKIGADQCFEDFELVGTYSTEHERDAVLAALAAREGFGRKTWTLDLISSRDISEFGPTDDWFDRVNYFWPPIP